MSHIYEPLSGPIRRWITLIAIAVAIGLAIGFAMNASNPQKKHMRQAEGHIRKIQPLLAADARFNRVEMQPYTALAGCIRIDGKVCTKEDLAALNTIVNNSSPPVLVYWKVLIDENESSSGPTASQSQPALTPQ